MPISDELAQAIDEWGEVVGGEGRVLRSLNRRGEPGERISAQAVADAVKRRGAMMGKPELACHDLQRTYAQLGLAASVPITQISQLLGHSSVATTQEYLDLSLNLETTISDFVPF